MNTRTAACAALLALTTLTAGCGSSDEPAAKASPEPTKATAATSTPATPEPTAEAPRALGETLTFSADDDTTFDVTVLGYEQDVAKKSISADEEFDTEGYVWAAVEIKACLKKGTAGVTRYPWALAYADGTRIEPSGVTYGDFPKPEYPYEADMKAGECVRGKTVFPVPGDQRPERVLYTSDALDTPAEWTVPKS